jgi:dephospho-CoA kinase
MAKSQIPIIGLIGGVGCGKSAVANWLAEHLRARVVDADAVGHTVLNRDDVKSQLRAAFGEEVFDNDAVSRPKMAARVFGDAPQQVAARNRLEAIVHPVMRGQFETQFQAARDSGNFELIVFDAAVLLDSGWADVVDVLVYVDVPNEERQRRVATSRGWSAEEHHRREMSQLPLDEKRAAADVVIDNSGPLEVAGRQLEAYLQQTGHLSVSPPADSTTVHSTTHQPVNS